MKPRVEKDRRAAARGFAGARFQIGRAAVGITLAYIGLYLLLDRVSFIQALYDIDITPWNPPPGLTVALLMVKGLAYTPAAFFAALLSSQLVPPVSVSATASIMGAVTTAAGYAVAAAILRSGLSVDPQLRRARDVALFIAVTTVAAGLVSLGFVASYASAGLVPWDEFVTAAFQRWIGDSLGIVVVAPAILVGLPHAARLRITSAN